MSNSNHAFASGSERSPEFIRETAADWISRRDRGLNPAEEAEYHAWVAADPHHRAAIDVMQPAWAAINHLRHAGRGNELRWRVAQQVARRRRHASVVTVSGVAAAMIVAAFLSLWWPSVRHDESAPTIALRPNRQVLPDGSTVELNFGAEIATDFTPDMRGVRLRRGEALFCVASDKSRPFVVTAGRVAVRAVGTAFTVRSEPGQVDVMVTEGRVSVEQKSIAVQVMPGAVASGSVTLAEPSPPVAPVYLSAGRRLVVPAMASPQAPLPKVVSPAEVATALAWRNRRVEFNGTPLAEAVDIFNRDNTVKLAVAESATGALRITGVFWTTDSEAFSRVLESSLGIKAVPVGDRKIILQR